MTRYVPCAVHSCLNQTAPRHRFPYPKKELNRFKEWISLCRDSVLSNKPPMKVYPHTRICEIHFERKYIGECGQLTSDAIPSLYLSRSNKPEDPSSFSQECGNSTYNLSSKDHIKMVQETGLQVITETEINRQSIIEEPPRPTRFLLESDWELLPKVEKKLLGSNVPEVKNVHEEQASLLNHKVPSYVVDGIESVSTPHFNEELHSMENTRNILLEKFDKICRICFSQNKLEPFFLLQFEGSFLKEIYTKLTSLAAHVDDKLPSYICVDCIETIINICAFVQKCQKSYKLLQEIVSNHNFNVLEKTSADKMLKGSNEGNIFDILVNENNEEKPVLVVRADNAIVSENSPDVIPGSSDVSFQHNSHSTAVINIDTISKEQPEGNSFISKHPQFRCKTYPCTFGTATRLQLHMSLSTKCRDKNYECIICKSRFKSLRKMHQHMKVHPNVKPYQCDICCEQYRTLLTLRRHQKAHEKRAQQRLLREKIAQQNENMQSCDICTEDIASGDMKQHMESHLSVVDINTLPRRSYRQSEEIRNGTKPWLCSQCPKTFKFQSQLYFHEQDHAEGKLIDINTYLCTVCGKLLKISSRSFYYHMRSHLHPGKKFICNVCKKKFVSSDNLSIHMNIHNGIKRHRCSTCGKSFMQPHHLYIHSKMHVDFKPFSCHLCTKKFRQKVHLMLHLRVCTKMNSLISEEGPPFSCKTCARAFDTVKELHVHALQNRKCRPKMHQCNLCKARFSTSSQLKKHIRGHSREKPYKCDICCEQFRYAGNLTRHQKIHEKRAQQRLLRDKIIQESESMDSCSESNAFTSFGDMKQPIETPVNDIMYQCKQDSISTGLQEHNLYDSPENGKTKVSAKQWQCSQCPKTFKYKSKLYFHEQDHVEEKHRSPKTYLCTVCGKVFPNSSVFHTHIKSHTGSSKKHVCKVCNKEFSASAALYLHMKIHLGLRQFLCTICGKAFVQKPHLLAHSKIHGDLRPFSCHICNNKFREKGGLTQHLRACTGITPFHCSFCDKGLSSSTSLRKHMETHRK